MGLIKEPRGSQGHPHGTKEEMEAQRGQATSPKPHSWRGVGTSGPEPPALSHGTPSHTGPHPPPPTFLILPTSVKGRGQPEPGGMDGLTKATNE